jgi:hypothetical protein
MGRKGEPGNSTSQKTNNSIEDLVGNKENEYPVPDLNRTKLILTTEPEDIHKYLSKRKLCMRAQR